MEGEQNHLQDQEHEKCQVSCVPYLPGAVSFVAAQDPLLALRAVTEGTGCACAEPMLKKPENVCARLFLFSHILVPGIVSKDGNKEKN